MRSRNNLFLTKVTILATSLATCFGLLLHKPNLAIAEAERQDRPATELCREIEDSTSPGNQIKILAKGVQHISDAIKLLNKHTPPIMNVPSGCITLPDLVILPGDFEELKKIKLLIDEAYFFINQLKADSKVHYLEELFKLDLAIIDATLKGAHFLLEYHRTLDAKEGLDFAGYLFKQIDLNDKDVKILYRDYNSLKGKVESRITRLDDILDKADELYKKGLATAQNKSKPKGDKIRYLLGLTVRLEQLSEKFKKEGEAIFGGLAIVTPEEEANILKGIIARLEAGKEF